MFNYFSRFDQERFEFFFALILLEKNVRAKECRNNRLYTLIIIMTYCIAAVAQWSRNEKNGYKFIFFTF